MGGGGGGGGGSVHVLGPNSSSIIKWHFCFGSLQGQGQRFRTVPVPAWVWGPSFGKKLLWRVQFIEFAPYIYHFLKVNFKAYQLLDKQLFSEKNLVKWVPTRWRGWGLGPSPGKQNAGSDLYVSVYVSGSEGGIWRPSPGKF